MALLQRPMPTVFHYSPSTSGHVLTSLHRVPHPLSRDHHHHSHPISISIPISPFPSPSPSSYRFPSLSPSPLHHHRNLNCHHHPCPGAEAQQQVISRGVAQVCIGALGLPSPSPSLPNHRRLEAATHDAKLASLRCIGNFCSCNDALADALIEACGGIITSPLPSPSPSPYP